MLCPEVWNFNCPEYSMTFSTGNWKTSSDIQSVAKKHYFNHAVSLVLPDTLIVPENLIALLSEDCEYYRAHDFPITALIENNFLDMFVKSGTSGCLSSATNERMYIREDAFKNSINFKYLDFEHLGQFTALSIGTRVDCDDCIAVTPTGHLILSLLKESYEELGLEGKPSAFCRRKKLSSRYLVTIDLKCLDPKSKKYERIYSSLSRFQYKQKFDLILAWNPPLGAESPSSVAAYFDKQAIHITLCSQKFTQRRADNVKVPIVRWRNEEIGCSANEVLEWLGAFSVGVDLYGNGGMQNVFTMEHTTVCGQTAHLQWKGFYTTKQIINFMENLLRFIGTRNFPWAAVHVAGYEDAPVCPGLREHRWYGALGDNSYTFLLHPSGKHIISTLIASQKLLKH